MEQEGLIMVQYIERAQANDALINKTLLEGCDLEEAVNAICSVPAADVVPVRHGRWQITDAYPHNVYCSECHKRFAQTHWAVWEDGSLPRAYCPNCGAKMDVEA